MLLGDSTLPGVLELIISCHILRGTWINLDHVQRIEGMGAKSLNAMIYYALKELRMFG